MDEPGPDAELDALTRKALRHLDMTAQLLAAQRAGAGPARRAPEPPPATTMPAPEFPHAGTARYRCPRGCGWWHDESTDPGPAAVILPAGATGDDVGTMLSMNAHAQGLAYQARVEGALARHYAERH
ncbi:hypothetical protein [Streptomyces sp. NPDC059063]|uniref:hypothetical protein n=1 Tax=Streptomyces sp. NPDC059063 TaxID=3346712 RepID=UPI0036A069A6